MLNKDRRPLPTFIQELVNQTRALAVLASVLRIVSWFGIGGAGLKNFTGKIDEIKREVEALVELRRLHHDAFSERGWIFSESTNSQSAKEALNVHDDGDPLEAESLLAADFEGKQLDYLVMRLCYSPEFMERKSQLLEAAKLTREGRYLAATPLLLIVADGVGADAFGKSIFAEGVDLRELNSFAGQPHALPTLVREMCRTRRKTSSDNLSFPYRNGIIHGRDLGYGNRLVNAKCWSLLGNIADVLKAREKGQAQKSEPQPSFGEVLANSLETHARTKEFNHRLKQWTARPVRDDPIPLSDEIGSSLDADEPEAAIVKVLRAWNARNFGRMADLTIDHDQRPINHRAGEIRRLLEDVTLVDATITRIEDSAPAVTEITVDLEFRSDEQEFNKSFVFRMICHDKSGGAVVHGDEGAYWLVRPEYQYQYWGPPLDSH